MISDQSMLPTSRPLEPARLADIFQQCRPQIVFVMLVWLGLLLAGSGYIVRYSVRTPMRDDWSFVSGLTAQAGVWGWIWEPWAAAKSRVPIQKGALYVTWNSNHGDLRPLYLACHACLAIAAVVATAGVAIVRGRCDFSDAFLSFVLLSPGNWFYEIEAYRVYTPLYTSLCVLLAVSFLFHERYTRPVFVGGCCLMVLALAMQHALGTAASTGFLGGIVAAVWITRARNTSWKVSSSLVLVTALLWALYVAWHFRDCVRADDVQGRSTLVEKLVASLQFLTTSLGTSGRRFWPVTGGGIGLVTIVTTALLAAACLSRRLAAENRARAFLLLLPLGSALLVAVGIGSVRDHQGGLQAHYTSYSSVLLVFLYLSWQLVLRSGLRAFVQVCAFALLCSGLTTETTLSLQRGEEQKGLDQRFRRMAAGGAPITQLLSEFGETVVSNEPALASGLADLHRAGIEPYRSINLSPGEIVRPVPLDELDARGMEHVGTNRWRGDSANSYFLIRARTDLPIAGLRVHYSLHKSAHTAVMEVRWPTPDPGFPDGGYRNVEGRISFVKGKLMTHEVKTLWTGDVRTDLFSFHPSRTDFEIELHEVFLLLAEEQPREATNP